MDGGSIRWRQSRRKAHSIDECRGEAAEAKTDERTYRRTSQKQ